MGKQHHSVGLGFHHGGDVTKGFNEEEGHEDFHFKKIEWVASLLT